MAWRRLLAQVSRHQLELSRSRSLLLGNQFPLARFGVEEHKLGRAPRRFQSSYVGNLARRVRDVAEATEAAYLKELYHRNDPEAVIRHFESQPSLHSNPSAVAEYVKALVKVDRLDENELVKTLQR
ncbi:hypothetical protein CRG98_008917, partial [Punica granatum]